MLGELRVFETFIQLQGFMSTSSLRTNMEKLEKLLFDGVEWDFITEILGRSIIMFLLVLLVLRLSGKRGVRQLTLFEVAIILSLGSAAGDPMFQEDLPVLYGAVVLFAVVLLYKVVAWAASESCRINQLMEGKAVVIVRDGQFELKPNGKLGFSKWEFFAELRNQSVEHLGQVRIGVLENDGTVSLLFYPDGEVRMGMPLFPEQYVKVDHIDPGRPCACMYCGSVQQPAAATAACARCGYGEWTNAIDIIRYD